MGTAKRKGSNVQSLSGSPPRQLAEEDAVPHLISLLEDEDFQVQMAGVTALGKIGGPLVKKILTNCIKDGDAALEEAARAELQNVEFLEDPMAFNSDV